MNGNWQLTETESEYTNLQNYPYFLDLKEKQDLLGQVSRLRKREELKLC
jgi:hypothetical protein